MEISVYKYTSDSYPQEAFNAMAMFPFTVVPSLTAGLPATVSLTAH